MRPWWSFLLRHPCHPRHSSPVLFTAYAFRTHVKAPQTDLHVKPDNSSGLTYDSPSKRLLHTKSTFQRKKAPKKHGGHQTAREPPKPSTDRLCSMLHPIREAGPRPEGQHRNPDDIPPRCPEPWKELRSIRSEPMAPCRDAEAIEARLSSLSAPNPLGWD